MKVGDKVKPGVVLAGIETDKAVVDFEMQEEGFIAKLLFPEGAKDIKLGTPIAILVENQKDIAAFTEYAAGTSASETKAESTPAKAEVTQAKAAPATKPTATYPDHIKLAMPNLSPTMEKVSFIFDLISLG